MSEEDTPFFIPKNDPRVAFSCADFPKTQWTMQLGNLLIQHTTPYSRWKAFWLRFAGWEVKKVSDCE